MKWYQKLPARLVCLLLVISMLSTLAFASLQDAFPLPDPMPEIPFTDVDAHDWYYEYVQVMCGLGLMSGVKPDSFAPNSTVPLSQGVTMAVRVYEQYRGIEEPEKKPDGPWYTYYFQQAEAYGLLPETLKDVSPLRAATRAELASILWKCLPEEEMAVINETESIPDYSPEEPYWEGVLALCQTGILIGDNHGRFWPDNRIRRSELAAVITRMVLPQYRIKLDTSSGTGGGMDAFKLPDPMPTMPFTDVKEGLWYHPHIHKAYALGLMNGVDDTIFRPDGTVVLSQVVAVAVRIHERYLDVPDLSEGYGNPWYLYYIHRAQDYHILPKELWNADFDRVATREEMAAILYGALPAQELSPIRTVDEIPDYTPEDTYYSQIHALYEAGVLSGSDKYGTLNPQNSVRRSELASLLTKLVQPSDRSSTPLEPKPKKVIETIKYGESGRGRDLIAYRLGDGKNVMVLSYAIHGWEDAFPADGQLLVDTANVLHDSLVKHYDELIKAKDWTVYILPCLNPDGLAEGHTHNGPGRCTVTSQAPGGRPIDLNRSFPYNFQPSTSSTSDRNYCGTAPLQAAEAKALASFTKKVKGNGHNVLIDTHGWFQQTIVSGDRNHPIYQIFREEFPQNTYTRYRSAPGYYSSWANYDLGYDACLFEFPDISSKEDFKKNNYQERYIRSIHSLLRSYTSMAENYTCDPFYAVPSSLPQICFN